MADRITADPAASEYVEAMDPQPEGDMLALCSSPVRDVKWFCPYRIGQTVEVVPRCQFCGETVDCYGTYEGITGFNCSECCGHGCEDGYCERVWISQQQDGPWLRKQDWEGHVRPEPWLKLTRRITSIRCEQRDGQWCWVVGLGEAEGACCHLCDALYAEGVMPCETCGGPACPGCSIWCDKCKASHCVTCGFQGCQCEEASP